MNSVNLNTQPSFRLEPSAADVSSAVLAVLREMSATTVQTPHHHHEPVKARASAAIAASSGPVVDDSTVTFPGKLLLERHAVSLPGSTRLILTSPATVVTPLAREILRRRGVIVRISNVSGIGSSKAIDAGEWAVVRLCDSPQAQSLEAMLIGRGGEGWIGFGPSAEAAIEWLESQPAGHLALLAPSASSAIWWTIRRGVRAAQVNAAADVERIVTSFAPRCIVIEPARIAIHEGRQVFRTWRSLGVHEPAPNSDEFLPAPVEARS